MPNKDSKGGATVKQRAEDKWIGFKILDQESGDPVGAVHVTIKGSDGKPITIDTLDNGEVRFNTIETDTCDLEACSKGHVFLEKDMEYTLANGDTLESIAKKQQADGNEITWDDIAAFNWGEESRKEKIASEHMRDELGCTDYDGTQSHMVYTSGDTSHTIMIPKKIRRKGLAIKTMHEIKVGPKQTPPQFLSCCGIPNITFTFNDSFIRPNAEKYLKTLKEKVREHSGAKLMIFGHTDKVGDEDFNKLLSERRAKSAFSLLTKKPDYWVTLYKYGQKNPENEDWGVKSVQIILNFLNPKAHLDLTNYLDDRTIKEIETIVKPAWEQTSFGKRIPDSSLKKIFQTYMDKLMGGSDIKESDFLPLKHAGCSEFNPIIDIDRAEEENRRVTFFLFDKERLPKPPCSNTDLAPCKSQCNQYKKNNSTFRNHKSFACAFYDCLAKDCDAEMILPDIINFDAHMHFMTSQTTPLPLLWNQLKLKYEKVQPRRSVINSAGKLPKLFGFARGAETGAQKTLTIADRGATQNENVYNRTYPTRIRNKNGQELLTPMIAMPMDMSYAHMDGYQGRPVYVKVPHKEYFLRPYETTVEGVTFTQYEKVILWPNEVGQDLIDVRDTREKVLADKRVNSEKEIKEIVNSEHIKTKEGFYYFLDRKSGIEFVESKKDKEPRWVYEEEIDMFVDWDQQRLDTIVAAIKYPFRYMPMYHYEPRRWMSATGPNLGEADFTYPGRWDIPFEKIATAKQEGIFIGFKMYTALGYKPNDYKAWGKMSRKKLPMLEDFYRTCQKENIPVLCHCSPSGMCTHDIKLFIGLEDPAKTTDYVRKYWFDRKKDWYYDNFVSPNAWEKVLEDFNKLRLCLAHFGGGSSDWKDWKNNTIQKIWDKRNREHNMNAETEADVDKMISDWYHKQDHGKDNWIKQIVDMMEKKKGGDYLYPNFFTDISYHFIRDHSHEFQWVILNHPIVKERVMFGTDWYMTELDKKNIEKYIIEVKKAIDNLSKSLQKKTGVYEDLWNTFTRVNPMKYYGIRGIAENYAAGLRAEVNSMKNKLLKKYNLNVIEILPLIDPNLKIIKNSDIY